MVMLTAGPSYKAQDVPLVNSAALPATAQVYLQLAGWRVLMTSPGHNYGMP